ncbi:MAG: preprotein translocase subunit SecG [Planctomycetota bacterium]|jgi:preprotein translocase subunit SecG
MIGLPVLAASFIVNVFAVFWFICAIVLILIVLIQKGRGGGLSAAFGGGMGSSLLGSKTGDFLTWVTIFLVTVFLGMAVVLAKLYKPTISDLGSTTAAGQTQSPGAPQPTGTPQAPQPEIPSGIDETTESPQPSPVLEIEETDLNSPPPEG